MKTKNHLTVMALIAIICIAFATCTDDPSPSALCTCDPIAHLGIGETCPCGGDQCNCTVQVIREPTQKEFVTGNLAFNDSAEWIAKIKDERVNCGSQNLLELGIVTQIENAIKGAFDGASLPYKGGFRAVFGVAGGVTIIVNNPATPYTGALTPDAKTMTFHINYLQSDPSDIQQQITNAVVIMRNPENFQ